MIPSLIPVSLVAGYLGTKNMLIKQVYLHSCGTKVDIVTDLGLRSTIPIEALKTLAMDKSEIDEAITTVDEMHSDFLPVFVKNKLMIVNRVDMSIEDK